MNLGYYQETTTTKGVEELASLVVVPRTATIMVQQLKTVMLNWVQVVSPARKFM